MGTLAISSAKMMKFRESLATNIRDILMKCSSM